MNKHGSIQDLGGTNELVHPADAVPPNHVRGRIDRELRLKFADFLALLPESALNADAVIGDAELIFDLEMVGELVTSGCRNVSVTSLREQVPSFFREGSLAEEGAVVDLPWQKVQRHLEFALEPNPGRESSETPGLTPAGARFLASFFCARRTEIQRQRLQIPVSAAEEAFLKEAGAKKAVPPARSSPLPVSVSRPAEKRPAPIDEPSAPDTEVSPEKLRKQRDLARNELARAKQESERQIALIRAEMKGVTAERNDALEALASAMGEENDRFADLELENAVQKQKLERALTELKAARSRLAVLEGNPAPPEASNPPPGPDAPSDCLPKCATAEQRVPSENADSSPPSASAPKSPSPVRARSGFFSRAAKVLVFSVLIAAAGVAVVCTVPQFEKWKPSVLRALPTVMGGERESVEHEPGTQPASRLGDQAGGPPARLHVADLLRADTGTHQDGAPKLITGEAAATPK